MQPTPDQISLIKIHLNNGLTCPQIYDKMGLGARTLRGWLKDLGLEAQSKANGVARRSANTAHLRICYRDTELNRLAQYREQEKAGELPPRQSIASRFKKTY